MSDAFYDGLPAEEEPERELRFAEPGEHVEPVELVHTRAHRFVKEQRAKGCGHVLESGKRCGRAKTNPLHHGPPPSLNVQGSGANHFAYQNAKKAWMERLTELLEGSDLPRGLAGVFVEGEATFPDRIRRDQGNFRYFVEKALGDALKAGQWIEDDDWERYEFGRLAKRYEKGVASMRLMIFPNVSTAGEDDGGGALF